MLLASLFFSGFFLATGRLMYPAHIISWLLPATFGISLLRDVMSTGRSVAIGAEHGLAPLVECAVVVAPITIGGQPAGTVGVLGPTRMNYPHALAAVTAVSRRLGENLGEA